ncbi:hypothetical protein C7974DRAFT_348435 [Boeremia exigua]|uniref:uncharacterized protein n=1 Tax=Boeremia exigua TaxID=749465 RepID=UPI001E8EC573|nr:uncharacterized protein C7974DRAFT_348435 [Boeremia exigua]KAH6643940.1 hypothetical protein C7974DRAFT_348435 [Boeremia exigua]
MRPGAMEAASADPDNANQGNTEDKMANTKESQGGEPTRPALNRLNTPFGQRTDGIESTAKAVEGVVEGVKTVVQEVVAWTEKKADELAKSEDHTGPYDSPATAAGGTSDFDVIATGVLPATVPVQEDGANKSG